MGEIGARVEGRGYRGGEEGDDDCFPRVVAVAVVVVVVSMHGSVTFSHN